MGCHKPHRWKIWHRSVPWHINRGCVEDESQCHRSSEGQLRWLENQSPTKEVTDLWLEAASCMDMWRMCSIQRCMHPWMPRIRLVHLPWRHDGLPRYCILKQTTIKAKLYSYIIKQNMLKFIYFLTLLVLFKIQGRLEPIPAVSEWEVGYTGVHWIILQSIRLTNWDRHSLMPTV